MATASTSKQSTRSRPNSRHSQSTSKPKRSNSKSSSKPSKRTSSVVSSEVIGKRRSGSLRKTVDLSNTRPESPEEEEVVSSSETEIEWDAIKIIDENRTEYKIEWAGVNPQTNEAWDATWEPKENAGEALVKAWNESKKKRKTRLSVKKRRSSGAPSRSGSPKRRRIRIEDSFEESSASQKRHLRQPRRILDELSDSGDEEVLLTEDKRSNISNHQVTPAPDTNRSIFLVQSPHSKGQNSRVNPLHLRTPSVSDSADANDHTVPTPRSPTNIEHIPTPSPPSNVPLANPSPQPNTPSNSNTRISESRSPRSTGQTTQAKNTVHVSDTSHTRLLNEPPITDILRNRSSGSKCLEKAVVSKPPLPPSSHEASNPQRPTSRGARSRPTSPAIDINSRSNFIQKRDLESRKKLQKSFLLRDVVEPSQFQLGSSSTLFRREESFEESQILASVNPDNAIIPEVATKPAQAPTPSPSRITHVSPRRTVTPQRSSEASAELSSQPTDEVAQMIATFNDYTQTSSRISLQRFISTCDIDPVDRNMLVTYLDNPKAFLSHPKNDIQEAQRAYGGKDYVGFELQQETNGSICLWIELDEPDNPKTTVRWESGKSLEKLSVSLVSYHVPVGESAFLLSPCPDRKRTPVPGASQPLNRTPEAQNIFKTHASPLKNSLVASENPEAITSVVAKDMGSPDASPIASEKDTRQELVFGPVASDDSHRLSIDSDFVFTTERYTAAPTDDRPEPIPQITIASPAESVHPAITTPQSPLPGQHDTQTSNPRPSSPLKQPCPNSTNQILTADQRSDLANVVSLVHDRPSEENRNASSRTHSVIQNSQRDIASSLIVESIHESSRGGHNASSRTHPVIQNSQRDTVPSSIVEPIHESSRVDDADQQVGVGDDEGSQATTVEDSRTREHSSTVSISESETPEKLSKYICELKTSVKFLRSLLGGALDLHARAQAAEDISYTNSLTQKKVEELEGQLTKQEKLAELWQEKYKAKDIEMTGLRVQMLDFMSQNDTLSKENRALRARLKDSNHPARHVYEAFSAKMKADVARLESENHLSAQTIKRLQARLCELSHDEDQDGLEFRVANLESKNETLKEELSLLAQAEAEAQALVSEARASEAIQRRRAEALQAALQTNGDVLVDTENNHDEDYNVDDDDTMAQVHAESSNSDDENTTRSTQIEDMLVGSNRSNTDASDLPDPNVGEPIIDHETNRRPEHSESAKKATRSNAIKLSNARSSYLEPSSDEEEDVKPAITDSLEMLNDERPSTRPERINLTHLSSRDSSVSGLARSSSRADDSEGSSHRPIKSQQHQNGRASTAHCSASRGSYTEARHLGPMEEVIDRRFIYHPRRSVPAHQPRTNGQ